MQVIGLCRFSYLGMGGFQVQHETEAAKAAFLYDPDRLNERFRQFEACTLPSIRGQTDPDFVFLVVTGTSFPPWALARLQALLSDIPQAVLAQHPPGVHRRVMRRAVAEVRQTSDQPCLQFRLDDDDAVNLTFVARLRDIATRAKPLIMSEGHLAIDFRTGWVAGFSSAGIVGKQVGESCWTPGLAIALAPENDASILNYSHAKIPATTPLLSYPDPHMFVRGISDMNDSRQKEGIKPHRMAPLDAEGRAVFQQNFWIDEERVRQIFSA